MSFTITPSVQALLLAEKLEALAMTAPRRPTMLSYQSGTGASRHVDSTTVHLRDLLPASSRL
jgi:hypothetical protein